ncbi:uncharacterized protein TRIADDRAFT_63031, partial [Trichoplax adhaerens]
VYTGKEKKTPERGLGARVVRDLTWDLEGRNHNVYMDNFFSSTGLFLERRKKGVMCCGTTRQNRIGWPRGLRGKKVVRRRGQSKSLQCGSLLASVWFDKKQVRTQFQFRSQLVVQLISTYRGGRKWPFYSNMGEKHTKHYPVELPKRRRCRGCSKLGKTKTTLIGCDRCKIGLCLKCFKPYHLDLDGEPDV